MNVDLKMHEGFEESCLKNDQTHKGMLTLY